MLVFLYSCTECLICLILRRNLEKIAEMKFVINTCFSVSEQFILLQILHLTLAFPQALLFSYS